ncbi:MAG: PD40 domain-containing protein, partial [Phycisphaerae bacterium]|nr:PD40 domain-containing protein [Phycisphaerae bacterium]
MNAGKVGTVSCKKARIAFVAALLCLLAYVLACIMSPAAWSPDSSIVAVLVTHPGDEPEEFAIFAYDIESGERVLLDEVKADGMLSPPTWSPDGKWIAYYRIEPSSQETAAAEAEGVNSAGSESGSTVVDKTDRPEPSLISKLFSEESLMLPAWIPELLAERLDEIDEEDVERFDVKLMIVAPDGKDKRPVLVMEWLDGDDGEMEFMFQRPQWSSDSKRLFYTRKIAEVSYIASLDIA